MYNKTNMSRYELSRQVIGSEEHNAGGEAMTSLVKVDNDRVVTSSRAVAKVFGRRHDHTLDAIRGILEDLSHAPKIGSEYFYESEYTNDRGRTYIQYLMNRDGFTLLAMGFTGKKAMEWKVSYIEAFNEMERQLKLRQPSYMIEDPIKRAKAWIKEQEQKEELQLEVEQHKLIIGELQPAADYTDTILKSTNSLTVTQVAKDYDMSARAMNNLLHELGVQYKRNNQWLIYSKYHGKGLTESVTHPITFSSGRKGASMSTRWTQKGRLFIYNLLKEHGYLPTIEME